MDGEPITAARHLEQDGFCVVERALSASRLERLRSRLDECAAEEASLGTAWREEPDNQRVWMLLNKGSSFIDLVLDPLALRMTELLLGRTFLLSNVTANIVRPGGKAQAAHADQDFLPRPWPAVAVVTVLWMLDDFTEPNGATRVIPGSAASGARHDGFDLSMAPAVLGTEGSMLVMDGRLWHGAGANVTTGSTRRAVLVNYCAPYLRQQENFWRSADPHMLKSAPAALLALLGDHVHDSLGMVNGLDPAWRDRVADEFGPSWR